MILLAIWRRRREIGCVEAMEVVNGGKVEEVVSSQTRESKRSNIARNNTVLTLNIC